MLDLMKLLTPKSKQKPEPVVEEPKVLPKQPLSLSGKLFVAFVVLHVVFLAYFIWFMVTASITETEEEVESIMKGEVEITKTTQLMTFVVHSVRNYFQI
jgi:Na+-transporting methylmalonyl-CoA/oxaloacetate decarboxylase gamma subunit